MSRNGIYTAIEVSLIAILFCVLPFGWFALAAVALVTVDGIVQGK